MKIEQYPDRVLLIYEEREIVRTVYLDSEPPADLGLSAMGYSVGHYEDGALVASTAGLLNGLPRLGDYFWHSSDQATVVERFSRNEQGQLIQVTT